MEKSGSQIVTGAKQPKTTFVQTDSTCFRDIVQRLTGSQPEDQKEKEKLKEITTTSTSCSKITSTVGSSGSKGQAKLKLHERRQYTAKPMLQIPTSEPVPTTSNQIQQSIISTDLTLHSPSSTLYNSSSTPKQNVSPSNWNSSCFMIRSPLSSTPAVSASSPSKRGLIVSSPSTNHKMDKDANDDNNIMQATKERRCLYLQSSPRSKELTREEPELLTLFPLTSPRAM